MQRALCGDSIRESSSVLSTKSPHCVSDNQTHRPLKTFEYLIFYNKRRGYRGKNYVCNKVRHIVVCQIVSKSLENYWITTLRVSYQIIIFCGPY